MVNYGRIRSNEKPQEIQIIGASVYVASNITPYTEIFDGHKIEGFEYDYVVYKEDEYIQKMARENKDLQEQVLTAQEAICDLYEMLLEE